MYFLPKNKLSEKLVISENLVMGSHVGLVKRVNEDRVGINIKNSETLLCISDGHWGEDTADIICRELLQENGTILNREDAVRAVKAIEEKLFKKYGKENLNENTDFTPEASFVFASVKGLSATLYSYGDCRAIIVRAGKIHYIQPKSATWLGAFSHMGLRSRTSIDTSLSFNEVSLQRGDIILLFTDGIDECIYEKPTIPLDYLAESITKNTVENAYEKIMNAVFENGAEDNASMILLKI